MNETMSFLFCRTNMSEIFEMEDEFKIVVDLNRLVQQLREQNTKLN